VSFIIEKGQRAPNYTDWMKRRIDSEHGKHIYLSKSESKYALIFGSFAMSMGVKPYWFL
jgi:hypothetical protein